jgi:hypothetical protein
LLSGVIDEKGDLLFIDVNGNSSIFINYQEEKLPPQLQWKSSEEVRALIDSQGQPLISIELVCGAEVAKDAGGRITWPEKSAERICQEGATLD